jgi:hypothetical protein
MVVKLRPLRLEDRRAVRRRLCGCRQISVTTHYRPKRQPALASVIDFHFFLGPGQGM